MKRQASKRGKTPKELLRETGAAPQSELTEAMAEVDHTVTAQQARKRDRRKAASRADKTGVVIYVHPAVNKALRLLAIEQDETVHRLGLEAIRLLLDRHGITISADLHPKQLLPLLEHEAPVQRTVRQPASVGRQS